MIGIVLVLISALSLAIGIYILAKKDEDCDKNEYCIKLSESIGYSFLAIFGGLLIISIIIFIRNKKTAEK